TRARGAWTAWTSPSRSPLVEDIRTLLFVAGAIPESDRLESPALVEMPGGLIALKRVEPDGRPHLAPGELQQPRADPEPDPAGEHVELIDPAAVGPLGDGQERDRQAVDDGDRRAPGGNQVAADPLADGLVGVDQRRARHELIAGAEIDVRHGVGVGRSSGPEVDDHRASRDGRTPRLHEWRPSAAS